MILRLNRETTPLFTEDGRVRLVTILRIEVGRGDNADLHRERYLPSVLPGYRRTLSENTLSLDRRTLEAKVIDEEDKAL